MAAKRMFSIDVIQETAEPVLSSCGKITQYQGILLLSGMFSENP